MTGTSPGARGAPTLPHSSSPAWRWAGKPQAPLPCSLPALNRIPSGNPPWKCHSCSQPCLSFHGNFPSPHCSISFFFHVTADPAAFPHSSLSKQTIPAPAAQEGRVGHDPAGFLSGKCAHSIPQPQATQPSLTPSRCWEGTPGWGHLWDPPAPQERLSPTPEQPWDTMGPRSLATVASRSNICD